jgi:ATP-binding protein involved in chromosome partitioning
LQIVCFKTFINTLFMLQKYFNKPLDEPYRIIIDNDMELYKKLIKNLNGVTDDNFTRHLDILLIDIPPGTGDLAISLGQLIPTSEILVVTTPQIAAAEVAERAGRIAHQIHQRVIGVIENMSAFPCPHCNDEIALFGTGGGEETAARLSNLVGSEVPLLGKVPFSTELRTGGDDGKPIVVAEPDSPSAKAIAAISEKLIVRSSSLLGVRLGLST